MSTGNPHGVIFVDKIAAVDVATIGAALSTHYFSQPREHWLLSGGRPLVYALTRMSAVSAKPAPAALAPVLP